MFIEKSFKFSPLNIYGKVEIAVVGCGGNGSWFIPHLCRIVADFQKRTNAEFNITLYDGDKVEEKNIGRQNFIVKDVGEFKSEVLSRRYGGAYGLDVCYSTEYVKNLSSSIVIGCVDNNATRKILGNNRIYFDIGNEKDFGQIIIKGNTENYYQTPSFFKVFPDASVDRHPDELSCAELAVSAPQALMINSFGAILLANTFKNYLENNLDYFMIKYNLYGYIECLRNNLTNLKPYISMNYCDKDPIRWYTHFKIGKMLYPITKFNSFVKDGKIKISQTDGVFSFENI